MPLKISVVEKKKGIFIVSPQGQIDSDTYMDLEGRINSILDPAPKVLILNMEKVDYMSSMGLRVILKTRDCVEQNDGVFIMTDLKPEIKKVFEVARTLSELNVFASVKEADDYLGMIQRKDGQGGR